MGHGSPGRAAAVHVGGGPADGAGRHPPRGYARAGVPEVWIVDLPHRRVEVYRAPEGGRYHEVHHAAPGTVLVPGALPELRLPVEEVFGGPPGGRESGKTHVR